MIDLRKPLTLLQLLRSDCTMACKSWSSLSAVAAGGVYGLLRVQKGRTKQQQQQQQRVD